MKQLNDHTYTLILTIHNSTGVLVRCAQIFNRRGHTIEAFHVDATSSDASRMTFTAYGKPEVIQQIILQLKKLIDVTDVTKEEKVA